VGTALSGILYPACLACVVVVIGLTVRRGRNERRSIGEDLQNEVMGVLAASLHETKRKYLKMKYRVLSVRYQEGIRIKKRNQVNLHVTFSGSLDEAWVRESVKQEVLKFLGKRGVICYSKITFQRVVDVDDSPDGAHEIEHEIETDLQSDLIAASKEITYVIDVSGQGEESESSVVDPQILEVVSLLGQAHEEVKPSEPSAHGSGERQRAVL